MAEGSWGGHPTSQGSAVGFAGTVGPYPTGQSALSHCGEAVEAGDMDDHRLRLFQREAAERAEDEAGRLEDLADAHEQIAATAAMALQERGVARELEMEAEYLRATAAARSPERERDDPRPGS
jgi:hypothetical protein